MPVPTPDTTPEPRRLLRDVVLEKLQGAIMDGTLVPGERLNDEELTAWLGVSRTPVREAIARLAEWGLIEMEANRYTRVAVVDPALYTQASAFLAGLHGLALDWGKEAPAETKRVIKKAAASAKTKIGKKDPAGVLALLDAYGLLAAATGNGLFADAELPLRTRVKFLTPKSAEEIDWKAVEQSSAALAGIVA